MTRSKSWRTLQQSPLNTSSREGLAMLLQQNIWEALHPRSMFVYLQAYSGGFS